MSITPEQIKFAECNYFGKRNVEELSAERECIKRSERVIKRSLKKQKMCETNIEEMSRPEFVAETKKKIETVLDEAVKMGIKIHGKKDFFGDKSIWNIGNIMLATYNKGEVNIPLEGDLLVSKKGEVALIFIKERRGILLLSS